MTRHQMFVYSDVADYTYVGNITAPILRIVSYKHSKSTPKESSNAYTFVLAFS